MKPLFFLFYILISFLTTEFPLKSLGDIHRMWERGDKNLPFGTLNMVKIVADIKGKSDLESSVFILCWLLC